MNDTVQYLRGALIAYPPGATTGEKTVIPFRFNPEDLTRQLQVEQGKSGSGSEGAKAGGGQDQASDASSGTLKEGFSVLLRFDLDDRRADGSKGLPPELGVGPEIAAVENLLYPAEAEHEKASDGKEAVKQRSQRPTVLFVWGRKKVLPVRITQLTIAETLHNAQLMPVRAEVEVQCEVLSDVDARDNQAVRDALQFTDGKRRELAKLYADTTADQGSNILPF